MTTTTLTVSFHPGSAALDDPVRVDTDTWTQLTTSEIGRIYVHLGVPSTSLPRKTASSLCSWAIHDPELSGLSIPTGYRSIPRFRSLLSCPRLALTVIRPTPLTEVVLSTLSSDALEVAEKYPSEMENYLCQNMHILRQGTIFQCHHKDLGLPDTTKPDILLKFHVAMLLPVSQGFCVSSETIFSVFPGDFSTDEKGIEEDDFDAIEIDEGFLGSSLSGHDISTSTGQKQFEFQPIPLQNEADLEDSAVYVRTTDLSRIGAQTHDWVICSSNGKTAPRLVRICADDTIVHSSGTLVASVTLLGNISRFFFTPSTRICVQAGPSSSGRPSIPTAKAVTVARVASSLSLNRLYDDMLQLSLKSFFEDGDQKLVKQGDILSLCIQSKELSPESGYQERVTPRLNEIVHCIVTNVEHDVLSQATEESVFDAYVGSTTGELGVWVYINSTKLVQTGIEHARIPHFDHLRASSSLRGDDAFSTFSTLVSSSMGAVATDLQIPLSVLLEGQRGAGKTTMVYAVAQSLGIHVIEINCYDLAGDTSQVIEGIVKARFEKAGECTPCILLLRHLDSLNQPSQSNSAEKESLMTRLLQECYHDLRRQEKLTGFSAVICATVVDRAQLPAPLKAHFKHEVVFNAPEEDIRLRILSLLVDGLSLAPDVSLPEVATQTAALLPSDLTELVQHAESAAVQRVMLSSGLRATELAAAGITLTRDDMAQSIKHVRTTYSQSIGAPSIPTVSWDDVGGLATVKNDILDTIQLPLTHPELFAGGLKRRSGVLLFGPPGTGKTLVAKAVATSFSLNFFSVKGPELLNMYIGESEANVRRVFQRARDAKPCVIFFDELDSIAPKRGQHGDSGGVMDRIVSQLLAELDGMSGGGQADVFVLAATNRPDLLDSALLRPGRFDKMLYLGVSETHEAQASILEALTRKFKLESSLDLRDIAGQCPFNYTGADFYALCSDALLNAMTRQAEQIDKRIASLNQSPQSSGGHPHPVTAQYYLSEMADSSEIDVTVMRQDFQSALDSLVPSVSQSEMAHYRQVQAQFTSI